MSLCRFEYVNRDGGYLATCAECGRKTQSKSREVYAACKASADYAETHARITGAIPGPGTFLKNTLRRWLKIEPSGNCPCEKHAMVMDAWGPDECEKRIDEIVGWLREEAVRRGLPFLDAAGRMLVRRAIKNAKRAAEVVERGRQ
jgi:hypothetical protein